MALSGRYDWLETGRLLSCCKRCVCVFDVLLVLCAGRVLVDVMCEMGCQGKG